jgi:broad specificity phosphatase PhoE
MILYCVRHGESVYNAQRRIQGQTDVELSPLGLAQSQAVVQALAGLPIEAVYSSPLRRARQTADLLAAALGLDVLVDPRLTEIHAGIFQGLDWDQIEARYPEEGRRWRAHEPDFAIPGGESRRQLEARALEAFEAIRSRGHRQAAIVAHGGLLTAALRGLLGIPSERNPFNLYNGSISRLTWEAQAQLVTLNETGHLPQAGGPAGPRAGDL